MTTGNDAAAADAPAPAGRAAAPRRFSAALLAAAILVSTAVTLATLLLHGAHEEGWQLAARYTARVSALWFLAAFASGPLARLRRTPLTSVLLRERRGIGLAFFGAHTVHLGAILGFVASGGEVDPLTVGGGGLGYVFVFAMAASSNDHAVRWLGARRWRLLHVAGLHYLWVVFALSYMGRITQPPATAAHVALFMLLLFAILLRMYAAVRRMAPAQ